MWCVPAVTTSKHLSGCLVDSAGATSNLHISYYVVVNKNEKKEKQEIKVKDVRYLKGNEGRGEKIRVPEGLRQRLVALLLRFGVLIYPIQSPIAN